MKVLFAVLCVLCGIIFVYEILTRKFKQPYQFNFIIGKAGSGKSTTYCKLAYRYLSRGYHVYGTDDITVYIKEKGKREKVPVQVKKIDPQQLFRYQFPKNSVILLDEMGIAVNNREFKNWDKRNTAFYSRYRHDKLIIYGWSQSFNCDKIVRSMVSQFWICERYMRCWSVCRRLIMKPVVVHPTGDAPSSIQDDFVEDPKLLRPVLGGMMVTFIPHWIKCYDTYEVPESQKAMRDIDYSEDPTPYAPLNKKRWNIKDLKDKIKGQWSKLRGRYADAKRRVIPFMRSQNVTASMRNIKHRLGMTHRHLMNRLPKGRSDKKSLDDSSSRTIYHAE